MKKFDFEMCVAGHPVVTLGGTFVRILCTDRDADKAFPIVALVGSDQEIVKFSKTGKSPSGMYELGMVPEAVKRYVNVFMDGNGELYVSPMLKSPKEAIDNKKINNHLKFIRRDVLEFKA